jgi:hypothetical protein
MIACALSLNYTLADGAAVDARPRFELEPDAARQNEVRFAASNLSSVDRIDVRWSSVDMSLDGKNPAAVALGKLGRSANTPAQKKAARANGKQGGRPKGAKDSKPRKRRGK